MYGNWTLRSDGTQNASITYEFVGDAGVYSIGLHHQRRTDGGRYDVHIDGILQGVGATFEGYGAAVTYRYDNVVGFRVRTSGRHTLELRMANKDAASTAYRGSISAITITRTADLPD
jgi:hypothetical protein